MKMLRSLRGQRGAASLVELTLAVTAAAVIQAAAIPFLVQRAERLTTDTTVDQVFTLQDAVNLYRDQTGQFPTQGANCAVAADVITELVTQGYLTNYTPTTAWGTDITTACSVGGATPDTFTVTLEAPSQYQAQVASSKLVQSQVIGAGPYSIQTSLLGVGIPGFGELLHRNPVPGRPELNQMNTALDMNGNNLNGANQVVANELFWGPTGSKSWAEPTNGAIEMNSWIDFHFGGVSARDYDGRIQADQANGLSLLAQAFVFGNDANNNTAAFNLRPTFNGQAIFNALVRVNNDLYFGGNESALTRDQGGSIELGGRDGVTGVGLPYIDFHFNGLSQDYNVRLQNTAAGVLTAKAQTFQAENDAVVGRNLQVNGSIGATDVVLLDTNRSLSQAVDTVYLVEPGDLIPKPDCDPYGLTAQIYVTPASFAEGPSATPIYQVRSYAEDSGSFWRVRMELLTANGTFTNPPGDFNRVQAIAKCS